ncbi:MAG: polysaccharide deacetylase family protein [candidate division Zixibacteria bacterium]|nr:polysaccharide deacetylase family protein [candidate division Zixibacteria bacterium]
MKKFIKTMVAGAFLYTGLWRLLFMVRSLLSGSQPAFILMYHRVVPHGPSASDQRWLEFRSLPGIVVSPDMFQRQIAWLAEHFSVISLESLVDHIGNKEALRRPSVVITFDDGWRDNYEYALPVLRHASTPATIFLSTGFVGTTRIFWPERLLHLFECGDRAKLSLSDLPQELMSANLATHLKASAVANAHARQRQLDECIRILKSASPQSRDRLIEALSRQLLPDGAPPLSERVVLDWNEIDLMRTKHITFGSHGVHHELFTEISDEDLTRELKESAETIVARLHPELLMLAYPNGNYNDTVRKRALEAGYTCAVTVERGVASSSADSMALPRINIHEDVGRGLTGKFSPALFAWHINRAIL